MSNREIDLSKPSLAGLSYLLRHPDQWPRGFVWNFSRSDCCAMGLACRTWALVWDGKEQFGEHFGISTEDVRRIFYGWGDGDPKSIYPQVTAMYGIPYLDRNWGAALSNVSPAQVADAIDARLLKSVVEKPLGELSLVAA